MSDDDPAAPLLELRNVTRRFGDRVAAAEVNLRLRPGTTLGIVGESGSGKTTCARLVLGLIRPTSGEVVFDGEPYPRSRRGLHSIRRQIGAVFQDPYDSLDPRMTLEALVAEPLRTHGVFKGHEKERVAEMLGVVGLGDAPLDSYPASYSGGGRQRIAIARGLVHEPKVLVCDEPTASLDVSVQAQILNLFLDLKRDRGVSSIFVSHDLDLVRRISDDIVVMNGGRVVESGPAAAVASDPRHPYTASLLAAVPGDHPRRRKLTGRVNDLPLEETSVNTGCVFAARCPRAEDVCRQSVPPINTGETDVACLFPLR